MVGQGAAFGLRTNALILAAVTAAMLGWALLWLPAGFFNHDVSWFVMVAGLFLDGAEPYVDFIEPNAPLAWLGMVPAAWMARVFGLDPGLATILWVLVVLAWGFGLTVVLSRRLGLAPARLLVFQALVLLLILVLPGRPFGQREHLFAALAIPYVLAAALRGSDGAVRGWLAVAVGLSAAVGAGMKPPLILAILALEAVCLLRDRRILVPELWVLGLALIGYMALTYLVYPRFFEIVLGWGSGLYSGYDDWPGYASRLVKAFVLFLPLFVFRDRAAAGPAIRARWLFWVAALGAFAGFALQGKGWAYQGLPALVFLLLSGGMGAVLLTRASVAGGLAGLAHAGAVGLVLALTIRPVLANPHEAELVPHAARIEGPLLVLSTRVNAAFPLAARHPGGWASRYPCLILIPGLVAAEAAGGGVLPERYRAADAAFRAEILADLERYRPALVATVRGRDQAIPEGMTALGWLLRDPAFRAAWEADYVETGRTRHFTLYERREG